MTIIITFIIVLIELHADNFLMPINFKAFHFTNPPITLAYNISKLIKAKGDFAYFL